MDKGQQSSNATPPVFSGAAPAAPNPFTANPAAAPAAQPAASVQPTPEQAPQPSPDPVSGLGTPSFNNPFTAGQQAQPTGDIVISNPASNNLRRPLIIVIILVVIAAVVFALVFFLTRPRSSTTTSSGTSIQRNLALVYDITAPVPLMSNNRYGFVNPSTGAWQLSPNYIDVSRYYGDYAAVTPSEDSSLMNVIDRSGNVMATSEEGNVTYDISYAVWTVDYNVYNSNFKKLNPDGTVSNYLGLGYTQVFPEDDENNGSYIVDWSGQQVYSCEAACALSLSSSAAGDGNAYLAVGDSIINLANGNTVYSADNATLASIGNGVFLQTKGNVTAYLKVVNNEITEQSNNFIDANSNSNAVYFDHDYRYTSCNNGTEMGIEDSDGNTVVDCGYIGFITFDNSTIQYLGYTDKIVPVLAAGSSGTDLIDLATGNILKVYTGATSPTTYTDSPFYYLLTEDSAMVCNVLNYNNNCYSVSQDYNVEGYGNYYITYLDFTDDPIATYSNAGLQLTGGGTQ